MLKIVKNAVVKLSIYIFYVAKNLFNKSYINYRIPIVLYIDQDHVASDIGASAKLTWCTKINQTHVFHFSFGLFLFCYRCCSYLFFTLIQWKV